MKLIKNEQGIVLIAVILGMLILSIIGITMASLIQHQMTGSIAKMQSAQAFYVADGGFQFILKTEFDGDTNLSDNVSPTDPPFGANAISLGQGKFWVEYSNPQFESIDVKVTAQVGDSVREVEASITRDGFGFNAATIVDGNLTIATSDGTIVGDVIFTGENYNVDPNITVTGSIINDPDIIVPTIDLPTYKAMTTTTHIGNLVLTNTTYTGDVRVTGNLIVNNSVTINGLMYVEGAVNINGSNMVVNGTLVGEGNINIKNNATDATITAQPIDADHHMPAIVCQGTLSISADNTTIYGLVYTGQVGTISNISNFSITGTFISKNNTSISNITNLSIVFDGDLVKGLPGLIGNTRVDGLNITNWKTY